MSAFLALEDGTIFRGESVGAAGAAFGEAVFTTAMTGYQETVTDPSFAEQLDLLHGADGGQLRRRSRPRRVDRSAREGGADAGGARAGVDVRGCRSTGSSR